MRFHLLVSFLPENPLPVKELFVGDAISSAPCRFWHSTCKAFIDDSCPLFTANFMCDLIHNITSWGYYLIGKRECHGTHGLPCTMKPSDFQKTVQCRFESCLKKVVRHVVKDYQQGLKRRKDKEIPFCELPEIFVENFAVWDDYETDYTIFSVCGIDIRVLDDELAEALKKLPERKRNTLLMYYFLEMTESEIANLQKITQSGVFRNRHHALETMKKILKEKQ